MFPSDRCVLDVLSDLPLSVSVSVSLVSVLGLDIPDVDAESEVLMELLADSTDEVEAEV